MRYHHNIIKYHNNIMNEHHNNEVLSIKIPYKTVIAFHRFDYFYVYKAAAVAQWVRAFAPQAKGWVFES